jgi:hypothetical protein
VTGQRNVQIANVGPGAQIQVHIDGAPARKVPLDPAYLPLPANVRSPSRLLRARAAVVPWTTRQAELDDVLLWASSAEPYAVQIIRGRGGSGKTRLAVEVCRQATEQGYVCGMLRPRRSIWNNSKRWPRHPCRG